MELQLFPGKGRFLLVELKVPILYYPQDYTASFVSVWCSDGVQRRLLIKDSIYEIAKL